MGIEAIAYWGSFAIPLVLLGIGAAIQKVVAHKPLSREHFYLGLDLTVYFLASTMINFLDIAKSHSSDARDLRLVWTVLMLLAAIVMLIIQMGIHQRWMGDENKCRMQVFMLCYFSNGLAILMLYGFVKLKTRGLL